MYNDDFLQKKIKERKSLDAFRALRISAGKIDFCSNDYLGIATNKLLSHIGGNHSTGATGARLLAGNCELIEQTESIITAFHNSESALIFNSGYDANIGVIASVAQRGDTIFYDALSHASIRDGIRLSFAESFSFIHSDMDDLEKKLANAKGNIFIVTESVFSMDGDLCPLADIISIATKYNAHIILDEAHATGVIGEKGEGLAQRLQLNKSLFCRMHTFGKGCGCHGAVVLGSQRLKDYLVNFARSFIYSTALPPQSIAAIKDSYALFPHMVNERQQLALLIQKIQSANLPFQKLISQTAIQGVVIPGNSNVKRMAEKLQQHNLDIRAILYPTVPKEKERLRIVLHAFNNVEQLGQLISILQEAF